MSCKSASCQWILLLGLSLAAVFQNAAAQDSCKSPTIIRTPPVVVPCVECMKSHGNLGQALLNGPYCTCDQANPSMSTQPQMIPYQPSIQTQEGCDCGCCNVAEGASTIDPKLLAGPIASFLAGMMGGLKKDSVTVQFGSNSCNCSGGPLLGASATTYKSSDSPSTECSASEDKLMFGVCQCPAGAPEEPCDVQEDGLYLMNQNMLTNRCPPAHTDNRGCNVCPAHTDIRGCNVCLYNDPPPLLHNCMPMRNYQRPENWNYNTGSVQEDEPSNQPSFYQNPENGFISKMPSMYYPPKQENNKKMSENGNLMSSQCYY